jgi:hypothetical protein
MFGWLRKLSSPWSVCLLIFSADVTNLPKLIVRPVPENLGIEDAYDLMKQFGSIASLHVHQQSNTIYVYFGDYSDSEIAYLVSHKR